MPRPHDDFDPAEVADAHRAEVDRTLRGLCSEAVELACGLLVRTPELARVWSLNQLSVTAPASFSELAGLADELQGDLGYRHVVVRDPMTADAVESEFEAHGWRVEHDLVMGLVGSPSHGSAAVSVTELEEDQMLELMAQWLAEEREMTDEGLAQVLEYNRREGRFWHERRLGVAADDGTPLSVAKSRVHDRYGWVEDVYTTRAARGRGFARELVASAADEALASGATRVVIVADGDDWPQHLYRRVGFRPVATASIYHREVAAAR